MSMRKWNADIKAGLFFSGAVLLLMIVSFFYTPYDPNLMAAGLKLAPPDIHHWFGTDNFGRDIFSRAMIGARFTLLVAVSTVAVSAAVGTTVGMLCGYFGKAPDEIVMRLMDALTSFPGILLALVMVTVLGQGQYSIILALSILFVPSFTRIARSGALQFRESDFVKSARVFGVHDLRILFVHILPNCRPVLLSAVVVGLSNAILAESSMSYLGLGIQPPTPSWGRMLFEAQTYLFNAPWCALAPGFMIMATVIGFHYLGEGIRKQYA